MVAGEEAGSTEEEQKEVVAGVGKTIFGSAFTREQIVNEQLKMQTAERQWTVAELQASLANAYDGEEEELDQHPLFAWLEQEIALEQKGDWVKRRTPMRISDIAAKLAQTIDRPLATVKESLEAFLNWIEYINSELGEERRDNYLPFRLHQFIGQTGNVYVSMQPPAERSIYLAPQLNEVKGDELRPLFPLLFSTVSGHDFLAVKKVDEDQHFVQLEDYRQMVPEEDGEGGYLIFEQAGDPPIWEEEMTEGLPETWFKQSKRSGPKLKAEYQKRLPQLIYCNASGGYSTEESAEHPYKAWYMPAPLLFDPSSQTFYDSRTKERSKLMRLGNEGRSTASTVLSYAVIKHLGETAKQPAKLQKLLSFTDNRQDAALQAGHFNDFMALGRFRSALYMALKQAGPKGLTVSDLGAAIYAAYNFSGTADYSQFGEEAAHTMKQRAEEKMQALLRYRALRDLRRNWRNLLPNLERAAMLKITYEDLEEIAKEDNRWGQLPYFDAATAVDRKKYLGLILDYFRSHYAFEMELSKLNDLQQYIKAPWIDKDNFKLMEPNSLRIYGRPRKQDAYTESIGSRSALGRYLKQHCWAGLEEQPESYDSWMEAVLDVLSRAGFLVKEERKGRDQGSLFPVYRLNTIMLRWELGDMKTAYVDEVRLRSAQPDRTPNKYFQAFYQQDFSQQKSIEGQDHTGQVLHEDRRQREDDFRNGKLSALFCSPTMELGIDISSLSVVHMRNVPPNSANYAQRSGRAGRSGQASMVITYCSSFSPHDRHYFKHPEKMVAGVVDAPRIDLINEYLIKSHLHAIHWASLGVKCGASLSSLVEDNKADFEEERTELLYPLRENIKVFLANSRSTGEIKKVYNLFEAVVADFEEELKQSSWYSEHWLQRTAADFWQDLNMALDRWRLLLVRALKQHKKSAKEFRTDKAVSREEKRQNARLRAQIESQIASLENNGGGGSFTEFYSYRYLAAEGFLPGYNFTSLPVRAILAKRKESVYLSRPRKIAIKEFGPNNYVYYNGQRYRMVKMQIDPVDLKERKMHIATNSGYLFFEDQAVAKDNCPITGEPLIQDITLEILSSVLELQTVEAIAENRISSAEEERTSKGYEMNTYFYVDDLRKMEQQAILEEDNLLLKLRYLPQAHIVTLNRRWKSEKKLGFDMNAKTGEWMSATKWTELNKKKGEQAVLENPCSTYYLYSSTQADALLIELGEALNFSLEEGRMATATQGAHPRKTGVISLSYALKRAIEKVFRVESRELAVDLMGEEGENPMIFIYEAAESSLGVLKKLLDGRGDKLNEVFKVAREICRFDEEEEFPLPATYDDLLSYFNQPHHEQINRFVLEEPLLQLMKAPTDRKAAPDYQETYERLLEESDPNSTMERQFLDQLHDRGLSLPDEAQKNMSEVSGVHASADFYYARTKTCIFIDGKPHDKEEQKKHDRKINRALSDAGYHVVRWHYKQSFEDFLASHKDLF